MKINLILIFITLLGFNAFGQDCTQEFAVYDVGFMLTQKKLSLLGSDLTTPLTKGLSAKETVDRISRRIQGVAKDFSAIEANVLATEIAKVSAAFGVDPFVFAALIQKESTYKMGAVSGTGSTGLTQLTASGLMELNHQYGFKKGAYAPGTPEILSAFAKDYLGSRYNEWMTWIGNSKRSKRILTTDLQFSLVAGASLLKVYLAVKNGDYNRALQQFNGDKGKVKYANTIQSWSLKIDLVCQDLSQESLAVIENACEFAPERPWACFASGQSVDL